MTNNLPVKLLLILIFHFQGLNSQSIFKDCKVGPGSGDVIFLGQNTEGFFFLSNDQPSNFYLWFSDGTEQGTKIIQQFETSEYRYAASQSVIENNKLIFSLINNPIGTSKLWISDGTDTGTHNLGEFGIAISPDLRENVKWYKNKYYFLLNIKNLGTSIWTSDGRSSSLNYLMDIDTGSKENSLQLRLRLLNDKLYFFAYHTDYGNELWTSDGTDTGTHIELDLLPGTESGFNGSCFLKIFKGKLCFNGNLYNNNNFQFYTYDISSKNLIKFFDDKNIKTFFSAVDINYLDDSLMFINCRNLGQYEVWVSDGTIINTKKIKQNSFNTTDEYLSNVFKLNKKYILLSFVNSLGFELWNYDETTQDYSLIKDLNPGANSTSILLNTITKNNKLYFIATTVGFGVDVWVTDGTFDGTLMYEDISNSGYYINRLIGINDNYYLIGLLDSAYGAEIYHFDQLKTSVNFLNTSKSVSIYPNPCHAGEIINVESKNEIKEIHCYDLQGRRQNLQYQNNQIYLTDVLQAGLYNLMVTDVNGNITQIKLIIQ